MFAYARAAIDFWPGWLTEDQFKQQLVKEYQSTDAAHALERLLEYGASHIQHMQKALTEMNVQLRHVVSDITGATGLRIIRAILGGERNPAVLARMRDRRCPRCRRRGHRMAKFHALQVRQGPMEN